MDISCALGPDRGPCGHPGGGQDRTYPFIIVVLIGTPRIQEKYAFLTHIMRNVCVLDAHLKMCIFVKVQRCAFWLVGKSIFTVLNET